MVPVQPSVRNTPQCSELAVPRPHADFVKVVKPFFSGEKETFATVLLGCLMQVWGADVLSWDPATVEAQVTEDFDTHMPPQVYDQLMALINVLSTDTVYTSVTVFDHTVSALNRAGANEPHDIPTPEDVAWAVLEVTANDPSPYGPAKEWPFSADSARYVGVVLKDAGLHKAPDTLSFADMDEKVATSSDPTDMAATTQNSDELTAAVDEHIQTLFQKLVHQLAEIGLKPAPALQESAAGLPEESPLDSLFPA